MGWTFFCWSAILVDNFGCILLCTSHCLDILLLICNTNIDTFGCILLCTSHTHVKYRTEYIQRCLYKYCRSTTDCPNYVRYRAEYIQGCPQVLQINKRMSNPYEVQSRIHPHGLDIVLLICNTCGHPWMHSALYFTGVGHSVDFIDLHYKWIWRNSIPY
jgi:hypothetical protein